jgi:hypothetical protein
VLSILGNFPYLVLNSTEIVNDNNGNGKLDPGENAGIVTYITNSGNQQATNVQGVLTTTSPYVVINDANYNYGTLPAGANANNLSDPYDVTVDPGTPMGTTADFTLTLTAAESTWVCPFSHVIGTAPGTIIWGPTALPSFPSTGFLYGLAYDPVGQQLFVCNAYSRRIYRYSPDSDVTYYGVVAAPDTSISDIAYSAYDDKLWVCGYQNYKRVWKISKTGTVHHYFTNPANDYGCGLTFDQQNLWMADRRSAIGGTQYIYVSDTLGNATMYNCPVQGYYSARCLAYDQNGHSYLHVNTFFNSGGTALDSAGVDEYQQTPPVHTGNRFLTPIGWNIRGIEYDPRDGNYWITIPAGYTSSNAIVKVQGFHGPIVGVEEQHETTADQYRITAYPNPASRSVTMSFTLPRDQEVDMGIYDATGRCVKALGQYHVSEQSQKSLTWHLDDDQGRSVSNGIYFFVIETQNNRKSHKVIVTR